MVLQQSYVNRNSSPFYKYFFILVFCIILLYIFIASQLIRISSDKSVHYEKVKLTNLKNLPKVLIKKSDLPSAPRNPTCSFWDCFNLYRCGHSGHDRITIYVYPLKQYQMKHEEGFPLISKEYFKILQAILNSKYYTANANEACLFVPSIDLLNQEKLNLNFTNRILQSLPFWYNGENHLLFNVIAGQFPEFSSVVDLNTANALMAAADFDIYTYRYGFDIPLPVFSPLNLHKLSANNNKRKYFLTSAQLSIDPVYMQALEELQNIFIDEKEKMLLLDACPQHSYSKRCDINKGDVYKYPEVLQDSVFCTVFRGERNGQFVLLEAMAAGCIPVVIMDSPILPFSAVLDWKLASVGILEDYIATTMDVLKKISPRKIEKMQKHVRFLYENYFESIEKIVGTTLDILQDRVFPQWGKTYDEWNLLFEERPQNPLFLPITAPRNQGFTAVILTYDRVESLFTLIEKLSKVPSLAKIFVVWNNQKKAPPSLSKFPQVSKPISVVRTKANKLSNRFLPYREIETEAILSIDDDIVMLTADELEFAYEVWREFPDRIVGFPSRTHIWDNSSSSWKYESEWTNEISMVLTGAAFYHKYWNYMYTTAMPESVKKWVDEHINCEDIAMNFLVANVTNKPPIKVAPRKKFKCPECTNNEMLSADLGHMMERSQCIDNFAKAFGRMPLKTVEFRADPVLYKDPFPEKLKRFNNIGSL